MNKKSLEIYYSGTVQGVGFRWTVSSLSRRYSVYGFVKNLNDGRVQLNVEGASAEVNAFLEAIMTSSVSGYIRDVDMKKKDLEGFTSFTIEY